MRLRKISTLINLLLSIVFVRIIYTDLKYRKIENEAVIAMIIFVVIGEMSSPCLLWEERILGMFLISVPLAVLGMMVPGSIGGGDVKLMAAIGFFVGWHLVWKCFFAGILIAAIYVLIQLVRKKMTRKSAFALGPFLIAGTVITIFMQYMK